MDDHGRELVERLFDAFNRRDLEGIVSCCEEEMEFIAVTQERVSRTEPYVGAEGLRAYLEDVETVWEELLISPHDLEQRQGSLLVRGRVYLRSRALGIRDMPAAWIWELRRGRFIRGRVFADPEEAVRSFNREAAPGRRPDRGGSRSTTPLR